MLIKTIAIVAFLAIIASLGTALFNLVRSKDAEHSRKTLRALTVRISLSLLLLIGLIVAYNAGLFQPQGIGARIEQIHAKQAQTTPEDTSATAPQ
jgi:H+/Cl- antiporter ClcA